ncbi:hypothetical protein J4402_02290 [Candidatus Pacearchaeota archaeon]|nr:hypothetical protein [Candidatus Pacearchaeota archaeon]
MYQDKFKRYLILTLLVLGAFLLTQGIFNSGETGDDLAVHFYYHPSCHFCELQKPFNEELKLEYPEVKWVYHDITNPTDAALFRNFASEKGLDFSQLGTPTTVMGEKYFIGFDEKNSPEKIRSALEDFSEGIKNNSDITEKEFNPVINLPFLGERDVTKYSLPILAVTLGLIDGFNPCAMWVLIYLISLILTLNDRKKVWIIVGSFVFASGVLYFLFMTAWLNVFLLVGYLRPLTLAVGLFALGIGILDVRTYFKTKGELGCEVTGAEEKKKTIFKIKKIVASPLSLGVVVGIIGLAFVVNSIEFVCSAAIPAIFAQVLALSNLSGIQYYSYILLYVLFFMLDDLIIFGLAAFAVNSFALGNKYAKYCKFIGGIVLIVLGVLMVFFPRILR